MTTKKASDLLPVIAIATLIGVLINIILLAHIIIDVNQNRGQIDGINSTLSRWELE